MKINYLVGDATRPIGDGLKFIVHCCNDEGGWGSGFVLALNRRWLEPREQYLRWSVNAEKYLDSVVESGPFELGQIQTVKVEEDIRVVNLIGQHRTGMREIAGIKIPPVDYRSVREGFARIKEMYYTDAMHGFSLHMPRITTGLAGGDWQSVEEILEEVFEGSNIQIYVYDLPG